MTLVTALLESVVVVFWLKTSYQPYQLGTGGRTQKAKPVRGVYPKGASGRFRGARGGCSLPPTCHLRTYKRMDVLL